MKFKGNPSRTRVLPGVLEALDTLRKARAGRRIVINVDVARLNHPGSPVYNAVDVFAPPLVLFTSGITLLLSFGMVDFVVAMIFILIWQKFGQPWLIAWRLHQRAEILLLGGIDGLSALWLTGAVSVALRGAPERNCLSPNGDLRVFVSDNMAELQAPPAPAPKPVRKVEPASKPAPVPQPVTQPAAEPVIQPGAQDA